jgi:tRNA(Arg) A34 adenosine deaminase TadA
MRSLSTSAEALAYLRDSIAHGEIEAMRLAMQRKGKLEPAADWQSPSEKQAVAKP